MRILIDAMGGDNAPGAIVQGAVTAAGEFGAEVVLVGRDGDEVITVEDMAAAADTFNYEIVCGLSRRVPRIYTRQGKETYSVHYLLENG